MKHVFILNPVAGTEKTRKGIEERIKAAAQKLGASYEIYITKAADDATAYIASYDETVDARFYAIGGDGTLNEVVNGIFQRKGYSELGVIPCGTGNDFARVFPNKTALFDMEKQIQAKAVPTDAYRTDAGLCGINMVNIGIDAQTAADVHKVSRFIPGPMAYIVALVNRFVRKIGIEMEISVDDGEPFTEICALTSFGNGKACGGGFYTSPKAEINDGLLEITSVRKVTKLQFLKLVGGYKSGTYMEDPKYAPFVIYQRGKKVTLKTKEPTEMCIDGEVFKTDHITVEILPNAIPCAFPE
ncbi:MAG: diacylglycerol kinase family lipid kinase [Firmicutes bacterium]|nr:diacylglycerol kinase family lipid kinase [Bacillota bacterium]